LPAEFKTLCAERRVEMRDKDSSRVDLTLARRTSDGIERSFRWAPISCGTPRRGPLRGGYSRLLHSRFPNPVGILIFNFRKALRLAAALDLARLPMNSPA
jgi:hypothetical protein